MTEDKVVNCPLLDKHIEDGLCLDIILAGNGELKKEAVPEVSDWEKAKHVCPGCQAYYK
ncbi:hypothetical protein [Sporomusa ovata]|uniref:hypothetical protein n=1 Tax=Sporomusa ovata TaxID=2378 RepID=UPI0012DC901D|nr:hypothetical protein [Sporomusa ovata]